MSENVPENLSPEEYAGKIFEISGVKFEPEIAADLWEKILQHKWLLSRFDCIIPVGGLNDDERRTILEYYLSRLNTGEIDIDRIVKDTSRFTPADIQYLFEQVAQFAFEHEIAKKEDHKVTTETIFQIMPRVRPSMTDEILEEFERDSQTYARV